MNRILSAMLLEIIKQNKGKTGWGVGIRYTESQDKELQKNRIIFCINKQLWKGMVLISFYMSACR